MQVIPLKSKYQMTEADIDQLSRMLAEGFSLQHMAYSFESKITAEQVFTVCGILAREMYDTPLAELCPHLIEERRAMNDGRHDQWKKQKLENSLTDLLKEIQEDLSLYELELVSAARA